MNDDSSVGGLTAEIAAMNRGEANGDLSEDVDIFESVARTNRGAAERMRVRTAARHAVDTHPIEPPEVFRDDPPHQDETQLMKSMMSQYSARQHDDDAADGPVEYPEPPKQGYARLFEEACARRNVGEGRYVGRVAADPNAAEKRELRRKIGVLRDLGFDVPNPNECAHLTVDDMNHTLRSNSLDSSVLLLVNRAIKFILSIVGFVVFFNKVKGPFLPLGDDYLDDVRIECQKPLFKYAIYQLLMRHGYSGNLGPWFVVLVALLAPVAEAFVFKLADYIGSSDPISRDMLHAKIKGLTRDVRNMFGGGNEAVEAAAKTFGDDDNDDDNVVKPEEASGFDDVESDDDDLIVVAD